MRKYKHRSHFPFSFRIIHSQLLQFQHFLLKILSWEKLIFLLRDGCAMGDYGADCGSAGKAWDMKPYYSGMNMKPIIPLIYLLIFWALLAPFRVIADDQSPDWWKTQRDVVAILMEQKKDIGELMQEMSASQPKTGREAMFQLNVFMRAGMQKEAIEALKKLKKLNPDLDNHQVANIYYDACDRLSTWELAQAAVEIFADNIFEITLHNRLLKHFLETGSSVEKIDRWLAHMPKGKNNFWVKERLRFNMQHDRGEPLVQELSDKIRKNSQDIQGAIAFLDALIYARTGQKNWELSWIAESVIPKLATEADDIGVRLKQLENWATAVPFYKQAITIPLTEKEVQKLGMNIQRMIASETLQAMFAAKVREEMAECLLKLGQNDEAQKWMVEASNIREKNHLGRNALLAGQVQGASGQRVIEERIKKEEMKAENDPEYWRERAQYYRGRKETIQEEEALKKGLTLTSPQPKPERIFKGHADWRGWLLTDYAHFLKRVNRASEAVALLRKEMEQTLANSESSERSANLLAFDFPEHIHADDEVLWAWLAQRPKWENTEERVLWRMLESAERDNLDQYFLRAGALTKKKDPSRAHALGWIMNRLQFPKRSIALLIYAIENAQDKELKEKAVFALFESYLDANDWQRAENIFLEASKRLTPQELSDWYFRIAVIAAKSGAKSDAMRIWQAAANIDINEIDALNDLVKAGLRKELVEFYTRMQKKLPFSEIPPKALELLKKKN